MRALSVVPAIKGRWRMATLAVLCVTLLLTSPGRREVRPGPRSFAHSSLAD
jgi:hypothetical protein